MCRERHSCFIFVCVRQTVADVVAEFKKYFNGNPFDQTIWHSCHVDVGCECRQFSDPASFTKKKMVNLPRVPRVKEWTALCTSGMF